MDEYIKELKDEEKEMFDETLVVDSDQAVAHKDWSPLFGGLVLIAIGSIFLFNNLTGFSFDNWWVIFIVIPAVVNLGKAGGSLVRNGRFTKHAHGHLIGGLFLTLIASIFLFELDWGMMWPAFLIIGGFGALLGGLFR